MVRIATKRKSTRRRSTRRRRGTRRARTTHRTLRTLLHTKRVNLFTVNRLSDLNSSNLTWISGPAGQGTGVTVTADGTNLGTGANSVTNITYFSGVAYATLNSLPDFTDFTDLFDQYKINGFELCIRPFQTTECTSTVAGQPPLSAIMYWCMDFDDATPFAASNSGLQKMRERQSYTERTLFKNQPVRITCSPRIAMAAYSGSAFSDYANIKPTWIDSASPDVQHYGIKFIIQVFSPSFAAASNVWMRPEMIVNASFRDVL